MLCLILKSEVDLLEMMCVSGLKWEDRSGEINKILESKMVPSRDEVRKEYGRLCLDSNTRQLGFFLCWVGNVMNFWMSWELSKNHSASAVFCRTVTGMSESSSEKKWLDWGPSVRGLSPWLCGPMDLNREHHGWSSSCRNSWHYGRGKQRQQEGVKV